ncbi:MAG: methyl-accepting chemotaxis protein [Synechococcales cyanobacterium CRU_2_2]|nr:methyl-accepting chemotaxis protein [Synechococcales cyanobacterium CRU_2_2]
MTTIPGTDWVAIASVDIAEVESAGNELVKVFASTTAILSLAAAAVLLLLANQLASPLRSLTTTAEAATAGNLDIRADLQGTVETQTLGQVFNTLLSQIQSLLTQQQQAATEQQSLREELEADINVLMEDISDAADGDLRVRAKLTEGDVGIIADLFNAIIENLRLTTIQVKSATGEVTSSLQVNEGEIRALAQQAIAEARSLRDTMEAVEDISESIQEVATNASQASRLTKDTYITVQSGTESMDKTVESILGLRATVGETAKKSSGWANRPKRFPKPSA